jgi:DNA invertase Pin-like site-specific DNA recombinase
MKRSQLNLKIDPADLAALHKAAERDGYGEGDFSLWCKEKLLRAAGLRRGPLDKRVLKVDDKQRGQVRKRRELGETYRSLAERFGVSVKTVWLICKEQS